METNRRDEREGEVYKFITNLSREELEELAVRYHREPNSHLSTYTADKMFMAHDVYLIYEIEKLRKRIKALEARPCLGTLYK